MIIHVVVLFTSQSTSLEKFKEFVAATTSTSGQRIGKLQTDNGGEFIPKEFEAYLKDKYFMNCLYPIHLSKMVWQSE